MLHQRGFTLIELLIVVGILSVLAAIATPNLLEAQTRAKVSRSRSDLRSQATALEAYRIDHPGYPVVGNPAFPTHFDMYTPLEQRLKPLTTPIGYINALPQDPFFSESIADVEGYSPLYVYAPGNLYLGASPKYSTSRYRNQIYSISGRGPDREIYFGGYCMAHPLAYENKANVYGQYDPTNGTVSAGDLFQLGNGTLGQAE